MKHKQMDLPRLILFFILVFIVPSTYSSPNESCFNRVLRKNQGPKDPFWKQTTPFNIRGPNGETGLITFGFDAELPDADVFRFILRDPEATRAFEKLFERYTLDKQTLLKHLDITEKQFVAFALRKGKDKNQSTYRLTDLNPSYFDSALKYFLSSEKWVGTDFLSLMDATLNNLYQKKQIPFSTKIDGEAVEIAHASWVNNPFEFWKIIKLYLHQVFINPFTHIHVGLPSFIPQEKTFAIARAIECRILLRLARETDLMNSLPYSRTTFINSTIYAANASERRGVVKLFPKRWPTPLTMDDLEIRQWLTIDEALSDAALASTLAQKYEKIALIDANFSDFQSHPAAGHLGAALKYAGLLFMNSPDPRKVKTGEQFLILADEVKANPSIPHDLQKKIQKFLNQYDLEALISEELFLEPIR